MSALKALKNRLRPAWFKAGRKWIGSRLKLGALTRQYRLQPISGNPLGPFKRSDTLFVLGSGASINALDAAAWGEIAAADSVGFNNWHLHPFIPTLYINEPGKDLALLQDELANLERRGYGAAGTPILLKDVERYRRHELQQVIEAVPDSLHRQLALSWDWEVHEQDLTRFRRILRTLERLGILTARFLPLLRKRASVFYVLMLALRAGYRRIVLCGIDLNNGDYFYESHRAALAAEGYWLPAPKPAEGPHKTDDPAFGAVTISEALFALDELVLKPRGIELFVASRQSRLYPALPLFFQGLA